MAKKNKRIDSPNQLSLFDIIKNIQERETEAVPVGSMDIDRRFREAVSAALRGCPLSRYQVVARMSELVGQDITKTMLDSWTAESKDQHRFPAIFLPAFCAAVGNTDPLKLLAGPVGVFLLPGPDALRAEIKRIDEEIARQQCEKKKRTMFLKEIEGNI